VASPTWTSTAAVEHRESLTQTVTPTPAHPSWTTPVPTVAASQNLIHFLLIGSDGGRYVKDQNTDTLIVAVVNRDTKQVSLLSIPRDLWVYIPTSGWGRINTAHRIGYRTEYPGLGPGLLMRTIEESLGIAIDHWVRIDLQGFARVVDELGGVDMAVACPVNLRYMPPTSEDEEEMNLAPGVYHMDGETALRYVRTRRDGSDFTRARRQHQFLKAVWDQAKGPGLILKVPALWSALKGSFYTDLSLGDALGLAPLALEFRPERIRSLYIGPAQVIGWTTPGGARVLLPQPEKIQQLVTGLYAPPQVAKEQTAGEGARIEVRNGTDRPQWALLAADQLRWEGLNVVAAGPADSQTYQQTQIIVFNDKPKALETLVRVLKVKAHNILRLPDESLQAGVVQADLAVILGRDYDPCK
jgi:LCP family protein required for cell wall assembly